jgi:hypothetical protein
MVETAYRCFVNRLVNLYDCHTAQGRRCSIQKTLEFILVQVGVLRPVSEMIECMFLT